MADAAVDVVARLVVILSAADPKLVLLLGDLDLILRETSDRERDAQNFRRAVASRDFLGL